MELFSFDFTAADDTLWTDAGFEKVLGTTSVTSLVATIQGNKGHGRTSSASERAFYRFLGWAEKDYKCSVVPKFKSTTNSRTGGIGDLVDGAYRKGYIAEIDMNTGAPLIRLYKRRGTSDIDLDGGWKSFAPGTAADLTTGTKRLYLWRQTTPEHVRLKVAYGTDWATADVLIDVLDTDDDRIESGGTVGILHGATTKLDDIIFDDLLVEDFEDEAVEGTAYQTGLAIRLNGVYISDRELVARNIALENAGQSYQQDGAAGRLSDLNDAHEPALRLGDWVQILYNEVILAEGPIRVRAQRFQPAEGTGYEIVSLRELGANVPVENPTTFSGSIPFNQDADADFYQAELAGLEDGEMLSFLWDNLAEGDDGLRRHGAAPASGPLYEASDLVGLDAKVPHLTVSGFVTQAEETIIAAMPEYAIFLEPGTRLRRVHNRTTAPFADTDFQAVHATADIEASVKNSRTVVIIRGGKPETVASIFSWDPSDPSGPLNLAAAWDRQVEASHTPEKAWKEEDEGEFASWSIQVGGAYHGKIKVNLSLPMDPHEWRGCYMRIIDGPASPATFEVLDNDGAGPWLNITAWPGADPTAGDAVAMFGTHASPNQHNRVGSEFELPDGYSLPLGASGTCGFATIRQTFEGKKRRVRTKITAKRATVPGQKDKIKLDLPALGLITRASDFCGGVDGAEGQIDAMFADEVEVELPAVPEGNRAAKKRFPAEGYEGNAFSPDQTKWGTGDGPGPGDPGQLAPLVQEDPNYVNDALQGAEYQKMAQSMLNIYGKVNLNGRITLENVIDTSYAGLNKRIRLADTGVRITGYESETDLLLLAVTWDFVNVKTIIEVGTLANANVSIDALRQRYVEKTRLDAIRWQQRLMEELRNCLQNSVQGGGEESHAAPPVTCATQVSSSATGEKRNVKEDLTQIILTLNNFFSLLQGNKDMEGLSANSNGTVTDSNNVTLRWNGHDWVDADGVARVPVFGKLLAGILGNLGKTVVRDTVNGGISTLR